MKTDEILIVYSTYPSRDEALRAGQGLVAAKLAACVNILPGMLSIYPWDGAVQQADEVVLLAKTRAADYDRVEGWIKANHPYECPCIVAWPLTHVVPEYAAWLSGLLT